MQEGIIVRTLVRMEELLRKLRVIAQEVQHEPFEDLVNECMHLIHRDIVFAPSLYYD